jgi:DNA mismatch endonuclease, patch repair protein
VDNVSPAKRSAMMASIRGKNTAPELVVRRVAHALGYRFRLHRRDLPGSPDLVFPRLRKAVQVHGCYWHRHANCRFAYVPKSNVRFWKRKFAANVERDRRAAERLEALGWESLVIWECETYDRARLRDRLESYLGSRVGR